MKIKTKLLTMVSLMALTAVLLMVGVWALKTVNFTVGGNLSYIAPGIEATISKGTMSNGVWVNAGDASTKMPLTQITRTDTEETLTTKFSYWQDLNLNFNETGDDVTITFSITNDMAEKYLSINVTTSYATADNATISINTSSAELEPDASQSFIITMKVTDKTANATLSSFAIVFHMEMAEPPKPVDPDDYEYLTFTVTDATAKTVSVTQNISNMPTGAIEIPAYVSIDGITYSVTSIPDGEYDSGIGFQYSSITSIVLPKTLKRIGAYAFDNCKSLTSITIPDSVISIGNRAFNICEGLISIKIPDKVTSIEDATFQNCTSLTSITIPDTVTSINYIAFANCTSLTSITIPDKVTSIGTNAFYGCTSLEKVEVKAITPPTGGSGMFDNCSTSLKIYVPSGSVTNYQSATYWSTYSSKIQAGSF